MGAIWMGSARVRGWLGVASRTGWQAFTSRTGRRAFTSRVGHVLATGLVAPLTVVFAGCGSESAPSEHDAAYAEIVAEEDARGEVGLDRVSAHLGSEDPTVRAMAVRALGRMEDPGRLERLGEMLDDPDPGVRSAVATAMAQAVYGDDPGAVPAALIMRIGSEPDPAVLGSLATNLGRLAFGSEGDRAGADEALASVAARLAAGR